METSLLTRERPDLWTRALALATNTTGMLYPSKNPTADGVIQACYGSYKSPEQIQREAEERKKRREEAERRIRDVEEDNKREERGEEPKWGQKDRSGNWKPFTRKERDKWLKEQKYIWGCASAFVPDGAMEWLLHEVGHWIVATREERISLGYGLEDELSGVVGGYEKIVVPTSGALFEREWQAWAFEEIILAPWGPARMFAPPAQRDGVAFAKAGPVPAWALRHAEHKIQEMRIDIELWRSIYGEWIKWGHGRNSSVLPWDSIN